MSQPTDPMPPEHEQEQVRTTSAGTPDSVTPPPPSVEDAGTQALSEALGSSFRIIKFLMGILVVLFFLSGMFTVEPNQVAVKLRFGTPVGVGAEQLLKPGWHWAFPYPIDEVVKVPVGQSHSLTSTAGWYPTTPEMEARNERPPARPSLIPLVDGYTLMGDGNIIHVRAILKYRITDPVQYAFRFANATNLLQQIVDNALFYASAQFNADAALSGEDKRKFQEKVIERVRDKARDLQLGVELESGGEVLTSAPLDVLAKFEEVLTAHQESNTKEREADTYARSALNKAEGDRSVIINNGINSSNQVVQLVAADAKYFTDQLPYYLSNSHFFKQRLLLETMSHVMAGAQEKHVMPISGGGKPIELQLQLSREPQKPTVKEPGQP